MIREVMRMKDGATIEKAFKIKLPPGSHTAEFQYEHGMVDSVVPRRQLRPLLARILPLLSPEPKEDVQ